MYVLYNVHRLEHTYYVYILCVSLSKHLDPKRISQHLGPRYIQYEEIGTYTCYPYIQLYSLKNLAKKRGKQNWKVKRTRTSWEYVPFLDYRLKQWNVEHTLYSRQRYISICLSDRKTGGREYMLVPGVTVMSIYRRKIDV